MARYLVAALVLCLFPVTAGAQGVARPGNGDSSPSAAVQAAPSAQVLPEAAMKPAIEWRASRLIGATMRNTLDQTVGTVEDVVIGADGNVVAVMVGVGGFLGLGETPVAIGMRHIMIMPGDDQHLTVKTSLSRDALEQAARLDGDAGDKPLAPE